MNARENCKRTIEFRNPERMAYDFPKPFESDIVWCGMNYTPDARPSNGIDEWGAVWATLTNTQLGEVKEFPLLDLHDLETFKIPDINEPGRWEGLDNIREKTGDKYILVGGISIYERIHFVHGLENTWIDICEEPALILDFINILVDMNLQVIRRFAALGADGFILADDWGMQDRLMISPEKWRELWKPAYKCIFDECHAHNINTFLHSCGYIVDILDDLIEIGLDVIHMDQQENMGLELLGKRFGGRITFYSPVDIQNTMINGSDDDIRDYCKQMFQHLWRPKGGFIPRWYTDPVGAGHTQQKLSIMCEEFLRLGEDRYKDIHLN